MPLQVKDAGGNTVNVDAVGDGVGTPFRPSHRIIDGDFATLGAQADALAASDVGTASLMAVLKRFTRKQNFGLRTSNPQHRTNVAAADKLSLASVAMAGTTGGSLSSS